MKSLMFGLLVAAALCLAPAAHAQSVNDTLCSTFGVGCQPSFSHFSCPDENFCGCPAGAVAVNGGGQCYPPSTPVGWGPWHSDDQLGWLFYCSGGAPLATVVLCQS
jgi:hypothetical protein